MKKIILVSLIAILPIMMFADIFAKTGTAALQFLKLGIDARATGMGEAYVAVSDDISSVFWNPAGLSSRLENQTFFSHTSYVAGISHEYAATSFTDGIQALAVSASVLHMDEMDVVDDTFEATGKKFNASDIAIGLTYSNAFTDRFSFGMTAKYLRENLYEYDVNTYSIDLGSLYNTQWNELTIGMTLRNFGPDVIYEIDNDDDGETDEDPFDLLDNDGDGLIDEDDEELGFKIPMNFSIGLSIEPEIFKTDSQKVILSAQLDNCIDRRETWNLGGEYNYKNFSLRSGYQLGYDETTYSFGAGFKVNTSFAVFQIDYAYTDMGDLTEDFVNGVHRLSVKMFY